MRVGIFGSLDDAQSASIASALEEIGLEPVIVEYLSIEEGADHSLSDGTFYYRGQSLDDVVCWYLRYIYAPFPSKFEMDGNLYLHKDWRAQFMHGRESFSYVLSWLLSLELKGIPVVNPPEHGSLVQLKPFQLEAAKRAGFETPKTLVTNNPERVLSFYQVLNGEVVYKPCSGGAIVKQLDAEKLAELELITKSPVMFQELIAGTCVRLTLIGDELVSSVSIPTSSLDYRDNPQYEEGKQTYEPVEIPTALSDKCRQLMKDLGLLFSGIDVIEKPDGSWVFLEANSSPVFLDIEQKTGAPISKRLANYLARLVYEPEVIRRAREGAARVRSFIDYAR